MHSNYTTYSLSSSPHVDKIVQKIKIIKSKPGAWVTESHSPVLWGNDLTLSF